MANDNNTSIIDYEDYEPDNFDSKLHSVFLPVVYSVTFIFGLIGNLLVIIIFIFYEKVRTLTDTFLVNLATADMLFLCTLPFLALQAADTWKFGDVMCKIIRGAYRINLYTSMLTLTCITIDRFLSITQATKLNNFLSRKHKWGKVICVVVWMLSVILAIPQFIYSGQNCVELYESYQTEVLVTSLQMTFGFYVPLAAILFCYASIIKTLINASSFRKHKSIKIIVILVVVFVATQLPFNVIMLLYIIDKHYVRDTHFQTALIITEAFAYLHACLNPVLYFFIGVKFRKKICKMLSNLGIIKHYNEQTELKNTDGYSKNISASTNMDAMSMH
ncbi:C-X-C chemokine receptor type 6 [Spea bombifrons]|uniref:C-X-C chemokine receptor type 6 n=1 Tax=Spea bombifrons TaxID=233779 RepID=UPI00234968EA|nr:C-X-C chemokine receptor type 6 [Spea bombifrons]